MRIHIPFVIICDFLGLEAASSRIGVKLGRYILNLVWSLDRTFLKDDNRLALFVGEPEDVPDDRFGFLLSHRRPQRAGEGGGYTGRTQRWSKEIPIHHDSGCFSRFHQGQPGQRGNVPADLRARSQTGRPADSYIPVGPAAAPVSAGGVFYRYQTICSSAHANQE